MIPPRSVASANRRRFLQLGLAGLVSLSLPHLLRRRTLAAPAKHERTAVIIVWLQGGASHLETYDPKPLASSDFRGPYSPIATMATGMSVCELLPGHARVADKFTLLRSMVHTGFCHQQGTQQLLTGHPVRELRQKPDNPDLFSITSRLRLDPARDLPNYVGVNPIPYAGAAYLGPSYEPFGVSGDLNQPTFEVPNIGLKSPDDQTRLSTRLGLKQSLDRMQRNLDRLQNMQALDDFERQAWNLLSSPATKAAFDIGQEDSRTRDRYGRNQWGQQTLMARRLVEAGVDLVTTTFNGALCGRVGNWDDHAVNHNVFEALKYRCQFYDQAVTALIEDLFDRGLDRRVLVIVTGEFGRTPRINYQPSTGDGIGSAPTGTIQPGRDHWPGVTSILFAGGTAPRGAIIGATDHRGESVVERMVTVGDFLATVYRHLGIDAESVAFANHSGRPVPVLQEGRPIAELVGS